jgi:hypothetical protein
MEILPGLLGDPGRGGGVYAVAIQLRPLVKISAI